LKLSEKFLALLLSVGVLFLSGCGYIPQPWSDPEFSGEFSSAVTDSTYYVPYTSEDDSSAEEEPPNGTGTLTVHFIDVGQGDSTFIELPNGETMLIDAGEPSEGDNIVTYILTQGYDTVDHVIATHPHDDHIGGMSDVLNNFNVKRFYFTEAEGNSKVYENMLAAISENGITADYVTAGDVIIAEDGLSAEVVAPKTLECDNLNDTSVVVKLTYKDNTFLFTGDAEKSEEDGIWTNIKCDVLKVGHHGSSTSTNANFLKKTEPTYAVISAGLFNSYGHPTEKTLKALTQRGIKMFRTDKQGTIIFTSDGTELTANKDPVEYGDGIGEETSFAENHGGGYVLNTKSKKIHYPDCPSVNTIKEENKELTDDFDGAVSRGYTPCGSCKPAGGV